MTTQYGIYIHFPWCIKKCLYCDFNSYLQNKKFSEQLYITKILLDFDSNLELLFQANKKSISSIFFGGGTPSLLSGKAIFKILTHINKYFTFNSKLEITLEVNPGAIEQDSMSNYRTAGITRISLGAQSFQNDKLKILGRIHQAKEIHSTITNILKYNFNNFNIDLMYGLPNQTIDDAMFDLQTALSYNPHHLSWYQLTMEPDTYFYNNPPKLPNEDIIWQIMHQGGRLLKQNNYINYEVSAFSKPNYHCLHNLNYWQYGDYLGLGPGAHSKITNTSNDINENKNFNVIRIIKPKSPKNYFYNKTLTQQVLTLTKKEIIFEFMLNNLRLKNGFSKKEFIIKTACSLYDIKDQLELAVAKNLLILTKYRIKPSTIGRNFLNDLQELFI